MEYDLVVFNIQLYYQNLETPERPDRPDYTDQNAHYKKQIFLDKNLQAFCKTVQQN